MQHSPAFRTLRPHAEGRPEDAALADFPLEERILVTLAHQQWASASDLAKRLGYIRFRHPQGLSRVGGEQTCCRP